MGFRNFLGRALGVPSLVHDKTDTRTAEIVTTEVDTPTTDHSRDTPVVFGTARITKPSCVWYGDYINTPPETPDSGGNNEFISWHYILCMSGLDEMIDIVVDGIEYYSIHRHDGPDVDNKLFLPGHGYAYIEMGESTQTPNEYLESILPNNPVPAFRGVVGVIRMRDLLASGRFRDWHFLVSRIHTLQDGSTQWYDEKSAIPSLPELIYATYTDEYAHDFDHESGSWSWVNGFGAFGDLAGSGGYTPPTAVGTAWDNTKDLYIKYEIVLDGKTDVRIIGTTKSNIDVYINPVGPSSSPFDYVLASKYTTKEFSSISEFDLTITSNANYLRGGNNVIILRVNSDASGWSYFACQFQRGYTDLINPVHIIRECRTNTSWGMGHSSSKINAASFTATADTCFSEGLGMSILWERKESVFDFESKILDHIDAEVYLDPGLDEYVIKMLRDDDSNNVMGLLEVNESNLKSMSGLAKQAVSDLPNTINSTYHDVNIGDDAPLTYDDQAMINMQGGVVRKQINYPFFATATAVNSAIKRDLLSHSTPLWVGTFDLDMDAADLKIGDCFYLNYTTRGIHTVMRVVSGTLNDDVNLSVKVKAIQDIYFQQSYPQNDSVMDSPVGWLPVLTTPNTINTRIVQEAPYWAVAEKIGKSVIDTLLETTDDIGYMQVAAPKESVSLTNANVRRLGSGSVYKSRGFMDFCPQLLLDQALDKGTTVFQIAAEPNVSYLEEVADLPVGTLIQVDNEVMSFVSMSGVWLTVKRGVLDRSPDAHDIGASVIFWGKEYFMDNFEYGGLSRAFMKIAAVALGGEIDIDLVERDVVDFNERANRPYVPGNVKINDEYFPAEVDFSGDIELTWAHRDRLNLDIVGFYDASTGPESGTTYQVIVDDMLGNQVYFQSGITASSATITNGSFSLEQAVLQIAAERDGFLSIDRFEHTFDIPATDDGTGVPDAYAQQTNLVLDFENASPYTVFTDVSLNGGHTISNNGEPISDSAGTQIINSRCLLLDPNTGSVDSIETSAPIIPATGDFTVEMYVRLSATPGTFSFLSQIDDALDNGFELSTASPGPIYLTRWNSGTPSAQGGGTIFMTANVWQHVAVVRDSNVFRVYIDGVMMFQYANSFPILQTATTMIGARHNGGGDTDGRIDFVRSTPGVVRYTGTNTSTPNFTPPVVV